jgi:hypothetical protein
MIPLQELDRLGYTLLRGVFTSDECQALCGRLERALDVDGASTLRSRGETYGSRNLILSFPEVCAIPRCPSLRSFLTTVLGPQAGLIRVLYFDKPPNRGWSLPWHKDDTIAVKNNRLPSSRFSRPTVKSGIPHVTAPDSLLSEMLTFRLHLDPMTTDNGPLSVIPGSHISDQLEGVAPAEIHAAPGDVLAMRPLLTHASSQPKEGVNLHRRIIHCELAPSDQLADGFEWHDFHPIA